MSVEQVVVSDQPTLPAVKLALDAAIKRIEVLEKLVLLPSWEGTLPTVTGGTTGPFTNSPATTAANQAVATDPLVNAADPSPEAPPGAATGEPSSPSSA